ncbi:Hypothetical predicted protein [Octopus vulgaris]|uniref:Uncharacterized protein n=1 Tax=Octopus vulgaris TaxID=6645 RepID=A0AA36B514_OCTVU|nr:Hypothetical predicted protein [Octopus vulgaris]
MVGRVIGCGGGGGGSDGSGDCITGAAGVPNMLIASYQSIAKAMWIDRMALKKQRRQTIIHHYEICHLIDTQSS